MTIWAASPERPRSISPSRYSSEEESSEEERRRKKRKQVKRHRKHSKSSKKKKGSKRYSDSESSLSEREEAPVQKRRLDFDDSEDLWVEKQGKSSLIVNRMRITVFVCSGSSGRFSTCGSCALDRNRLS